MGNEIFLSLFCETDLNRLFEIQSDAHSAKMRQAKMIAKSHTQVRQWLDLKSELQSPLNFCLGVRERSSHKLIGYVTLNAYADQPNIGEVGVVLHLGKRKGLGSRAINLLELFSSHYFGYRTFIAKVSLENTGAIAFFQRNDYLQVDVLDNNVILEKRLDNEILKN